MHSPVRTFSALAFAVASFTCAASGASIVHQTYSGAFPATITGTLPNQGTALEESITITSTSNLTAYTTSYAAGGFEPNLTLYNPDGTFNTAQSATPPPGASPDSTTGKTLDGYLTATGLTPGTYTLTLTDWQLQQSVTATNLSDGFTTNYGNGSTFVDVTGATRTGRYALVVTLSSSSTTTPEPGTLLLFAPALALASLLRRKANS